MKITNSKTGKPYQLTPGTQLEVERPNLFFNEWGEQTLPVDMPDSDWNAAALGYPGITNMRKIPDDIQATISSGEYFSACRQAILKVKQKETISTSFYLNEGSFLSKITRSSLKEVFGDEIVPGITTVKEAIDFCKSLIVNDNPHFSIFPVAVDFDNEQRYINRMEYMYDSGGIAISGGTLGFYNAFPRQETVEGNSIRLEAGYYMSPFMRASYLLKRIFQFFGYTLLDNFFEMTEPFASSVFINNTMDSLVNGTILISHLLPDCKCSTILNMYRKKFLCEFIPNEVDKTVFIDFFRDISLIKPEIDLSDCVTSTLEIEYPEYKQIHLSSQTAISDGDKYDSVTDIIAKYPGAYINEADGAYYREGYTERNVVREKICSSTIPYWGDGTLKEKKIVCSDSMFSVIRDKYVEMELSNPNPVYSLMLPYIGDGRALNSTLILNTSSGEDSDFKDPEPASNKEQEPILALVYVMENGRIIGTNTNCKYNGERFSDYSLLYNGKYGIYEKFYRGYDDMLRNSMHPVKTKIILTDHHKMTLPAHRKVIINGQELFIDKLKYSIGGPSEPIESSFYTSRLYSPVHSAISEEKRCPVYQAMNKWTIQKENVMISEAEYYKIEIRFVDSYGSLPAIYPPFPTNEQVTKGGRYYERVYAYSRFLGDGWYYFRVTVFLVPSPA